ncbi:MAG TPA: phosphoglucosamine mutase, partial [Erysipelothrix sp.]|nr:phosphoglucosamine mutase [Erysipelothrix sp.]
MKKYFGTDGIRGKANELLTAELALKLGQYLGYKFKGENLVIAKDPRQSSDMLEHALASGIVSSGANAYLLGVLPTPALAYIVKEEAFSAGVMISASHNPYHDNGLKFFSGNGLKMNDQLESEIEAYLEGDITIPLNYEMGQVIDYTEGKNIYIDYVESIVDVNLKGLKIVLDLANGASVTTAYQVFKDLGADIVVMNDKPNGVNINDKAGSTYISYLQKKVVEEKADFGFAFDGDADRVLASDHKGNLIDGDKILYVLAKSMHEDGKLKDNTVVSTVMANLGFIHSMKDNHFKVIQTDVGDRHVAKEMFDHGYTLGGEQSGHILIKEFGTTGDGVMVALKLAETVKKTNT